MTTLTPLLHHEEGILPDLGAPDFGPRDDLPCRQDDGDLWFADSPAELETAKDLCTGCPVMTDCLLSAIERREPWGVWGGQIFERGEVIARKRPRGRPPKASSQRSC